MAEPKTDRITEVRFTLPLAQAPAAAWHRLVADIDQWWPADFRVLTGSRMQLEPRVGGALSERGAGDDGVLWYTIQAIHAPQWLVLSGFIAPPWGGPAVSLLRLSLVDGDGGTELELHDAILGRADAAAVEAGWRAIFAGFAR